MIILERNDDYNENLEIDLNLKNLVNTILLHFNSFLEYLAENYPDYFLPYIRALGKRLSEIIKREEEVSAAVFSLLRNYRLKQKGKDLVILDFFRLLQSKLIEVIKLSLDLNKYHFSKRGTKLRVKLFDRTKGIIVPTYLIAIALKDFMQREKAIEFYKKYIDFIYESKELAPPTMEYVEEIIELHEKEYKYTHNYVAFKQEEGKIGVKINKCMIQEALKDFDANYDKELAYYVLCYHDFHTTKRMNKNFSLTREKTIMIGNYYCDFCWIDKRLSEEKEHPEKEFWIDLE
ncbi:MAG: L-2-amino-thiazoline-4-carboxylic acid hydrolase [Candidatus Thorarchaeota archaeon]